MPFELLVLVKIGFFECKPTLKTPWITQMRQSRAALNITVLDGRVSHTPR